MINTLRPPAGAVATLLQLAVAGGLHGVSLRTGPPSSRYGVGGRPRCHITIALMPTTEQPWGYAATFADPDGHVWQVTPLSTLPLYTK